jgi:hypothetical protein
MADGQKGGGPIVCGSPNVRKSERLLAGLFGIPNAGTLSGI